MGEQDDFTVSDSELLLAFSNIEIDDNSLKTLLRQLSEESRDRGLDVKSGNVILNFDRWLTAVMSHIRGRLMTGVLGTKYGLSAPSYLDNMDQHSSASISPGRSNRGGGGGGGVGVVMGGGLSVIPVQEPFSTLFQRAAHSGMSDLQISVRSRQSSPSSFSGGYIGHDRERDGDREREKDRDRGRDREGDRERSKDREREREPADFSRTFDSSAPNESNSNSNSNSSSFRDNSFHDNPGNVGEECSEQLNHVLDGKGQTDVIGSESRESGRSAREDIGMGPRPNSFSLDSRRHSVSADFSTNLTEKSEWTRLVASRSVNNVNAAAAGAVRVRTLSLPPVKAQQLKTTAAKKKMLLSNGFNESFGRATPRCLKSDNLSGTSITGSAKSNSSAMGSTQGTFGGQNKDLDNYPILTDTKTIMDTVEVLRKGK